MLLTNRKGPLAAQSLELPEPYSLPARISKGTPDCWYRSAASNTSNCKKGRCTTGFTISNFTHHIKKCKFPCWLEIHFNCIKPMFTDENREMTYSNHVSCWQMNCLRRLLIEELVKESDVCKRSSGHHGVVPSARTVGVEIPSSQTDQNTHKKKSKQRYS